MSLKQSNALSAEVQSGAEVIPSSGERQQAMLTAAPRKEGRWVDLLPLRCIIVTALILPFFFGGRHSTAPALVELLIFSWAAVISLHFLMKGSKAGEGEGMRLRSRTGAAAAAAFGGLALLQTTPLPFFAADFISPAAAALYRMSEAPAAYLSIEPSTTAAALFWFAALALVYLWLTSLPQESVRISYSSQSRKLRSTDHFFEQSRETDRIADVLQWTVTVAGTLCAITAITHWALRSEALFGLFDPGRGASSQLRAHWPFVNPDHLSALLGIAIATAFARLLRLSHLRALRGRGPAAENLALRLLQSPAQLGKQLPYALAVFTMVLANVLTLSRAGNALTAAALVVLYFGYRRLGRYTFSRSVKVSRVLYERGEAVYRAAGRAARGVGALFFVAAVLFFLGQTGRDLAANRLEYGLAAGYDESRQMLNQAALAVISRFPVSGVGLGCWGLGAAAHIPKDLAGYTIDFAHNDYMQLAGEMGLPGAGVVLFALFAAAASLRRVWRKGLLEAQRIELFGSALPLVVLLLHAAVDFPFHIPAISLVFVLSLAGFMRLVHRAQA